jgi:hypothetical protein
MARRPSNQQSALRVQRTGFTQSQWQESSRQVQVGPLENTSWLWLRGSCGQRASQVPVPRSTKQSSSAKQATGVAVIDRPGRHVQKFSTQEQAPSAGVAAGVASAAAPQRTA